MAIKIQNNGETMNNKRKIFAVSDIHGFYNELINALNNAGYDENNPEHLLISLGDAFDRGSQSLDVYNYLKRLEDENKAIILKGNHTLFLEQYLEGTSLSPFNYMRNGTDETLADFLHETRPFETWCLFNLDKEPTYGDFASWITIAKNTINQEYPELLGWLKNKQYYYETKNYIFTHGAIDVNAEDWHHPHCVKYNYIDWEALMWDDGTFFGSNINNTNKTVVIGHFGTTHLREMYDINDGKANNSILIRDDNRVIAIDATTALSHEVNVLVIEDELI